MKTLNKFILEKFELYGVKNLEVVFDVNNKDKFIEFEIPETSSEDDFQIYIQDMFFNDLPGSDTLLEKFFGKNKKYLLDSYFEYDKYEKEKDSKSNDYIKFNSQLIDNKEGVDLVFVRVYGLKYILKFDTFEYKCEDVNDTKQTLIDIFKKCELNKLNDFPLKLTLNEDKMKYI